MSNEIGPGLYKCLRAADDLASDILKQPYPQWTMEELEERVAELAHESVRWEFEACKWRRVATACACVATVLLQALIWMVIR